MGSLQDQLLQTARKNYYPLSGTFELTPRCTLDCKMCYIHLTKEQMGDRKELTTEQWLKIVDEAADAGTVFVQLTGGECMMHPGFKEIYLRVRERKMIPLVNTNATLLTDENIAFFKKNPPNRLQISLYGFSEDSYEQLAGHRVFERVISNVLKAKEAGLNIKISITVSKYLYDDTLAILKFAIENHFPYAIDMDMTDAFDDTGRSLDDYALTPEQAATKAAEIARFLGKKPLNNPYEPNIPPLDTSGKESRGFICSAGRSKYVIKWDGSFAPCFTDGKDCPNILETGFAKGWEEVIRLGKEYLYPIECLSCKFNKICTSCPFRREDPKNPGHRNEKTCRLTIAKYNAGIGKIAPSSTDEDF